MTQTYELHILLETLFTFLALESERKYASGE